MLSEFQAGTKPLEGKALAFGRIALAMALESLSLWNQPPANLLAGDNFPDDLTRQALRDRRLRENEAGSDVIICSVR
jgi:hypothetical protein